MSFRAQDWLDSFRLEKSLLHIDKKEKAKTIAITGAKGGVGKTTISLKLSKDLANQGKKVLLIDFDYNLSNTAIKLGVPLNNNFYKLLYSNETFENCLYKEGNFHLLPACNGNMDLINQNSNIHNFVLEIIRDCEDKYDYIFLDSPAGLMNETLILNAYMDHRIVVITPDKASITDSYSLIKILNKKFGIKDNFLLVNKVQRKEDYLRTIKSLTDTVNNFLETRLKVLGPIKYDQSEYSAFEKNLFKGVNSSLQKSFDKVTRIMTDELIKGNIDSMIESASVSQS